MSDQTSFVDGNEGEQIEDTRYDYLLTPDTSGVNYTLEITMPDTFIEVFWGLLIEGEHTKNWLKSGSMEVEEAIRHMWEIRVLSSHVGTGVGLLLPSGDFLTIGGELFTIPA